MKKAFRVLVKVGSIYRYFEVTEIDYTYAKQTLTTYLTNRDNNRSVKVIGCVETIESNNNIGHVEEIK